jgi:hypothetical protein
MGIKFEKWPIKDTMEMRSLLLSLFTEKFFYSNVPFSS